MSAPSSSSGDKPTRARHIVLGFILALTGVSYLDRVCISMAAPAIKLDLDLTDAQMGHVFSAFIFAYALSEIPMGWMADRFGPRLMLARVVVWWSAFTAATGFAGGFASLVAVRLLFGIGEAGTFPGVARTFSHWLPARARGRAFGLAVMAATLTGALTYKLVAKLIEISHWRTVFYLFGVAGMVWAVAWLWWFRDDPRRHRGVNRAELDLIGMEAPGKHRPVPWRRFVRSRNLYALCLMYFSVIYGWYFYLTWFPEYMLRARGFNLQETGWLASLPLVGLALGVVSGGWASDLLRRRVPLITARRLPALIGLPLSACALLGAIFVSHPIGSVLLFAGSAALSALAVAPAWAVCLDVGRWQAGVLSGTMNMFGNLGGALSPEVIGLCLTYLGSWNAPLLSLGVLYLVAALCWLLIDPSQPIEEPGEPA